MLWTDAVAAITCS